MYFVYIRGSECEFRVRLGILCIVIEVLCLVDNVVLCIDRGIWKLYCYRICVGSDFISKVRGDLWCGYFDLLNDSILVSIKII